MKCVWQQQLRDFHFRSSDRWFKTHPTVVKLRWTHNHALDDANSLKYRDPSEEVQAVFLQLFSVGHNPKSALTHYLNDPELDKLGDPEKTAADTSIIPTTSFLYR